MNVTLGVPRIKEIINASSSIKTPIIKVKLENNKDEHVARIVKGRIEKTTLGDIAEYIKEVYTRTEAYILIKIDLVAIERLQLEVDINSVKFRILSHKSLKLNQQLISVDSDDTLRIYAAENAREKLMFKLRSLKLELPNVLVNGIEGVHRAVINDDGKGHFELIVEGTNLLQVLGTSGVLARLSLSNDVLEVMRVLGIEAARATIIQEIQTTMESHGLTVDPRHVQLLADVMSYRGQILGITRHGIAKMKSSVLMLASFEKTGDYLFEAAAHGSTDGVDGVSECIIMGVPMSVGTGLFKLVQDVTLPATQNSAQSIFRNARKS
jgi:DNA-directed RNA polymerase III subunit RPC1